MTQSVVRSRQFELSGIFWYMYNGNRSKERAGGIGYSSSSSRLSILVGVPSWRRLWPGQSLTQNTRLTGTAFGVRSPPMRAHLQQERPDVVRCDVLNLLNSLQFQVVPKPPQFIPVVLHCP
jgi:hypothetical protein